jgi:hypothetical protein
MDVIPGMVPDKLLLGRQDNCEEFSGTSFNCQDTRTEATIQLEKADDT